MVAVAIAQKHIAARFGHQHIGKVFGAHGGLLRLNAVRPHQRGHHAAGKVGLGRAVDGGRVVAAELKRAFDAKGCCRVLRHFAHALLQHVQHLKGERAHRALQLAKIGNHIGGFARVDHGHRDHPGVNGFKVAAHNRLKGLHHLAGHRHRV